MFSKLKVIKDFFFDFKNFRDEAFRYEMYKLMLLGFTFFFIIGSYSILRPLKTSVFLGLVGKEYQPITKLISIINLFPCLLLYAKLVDKLRRYQVVYFFFGVYIIGSTLLAIALSHPIMGLHNTDTNPYRILGWVFYLFIDLFSPLVVSTFWAFANSINSPNHAKRSYGKIVAISRVGGIITSMASWYIMQKAFIPYAISIPYLLVIASIFLSLACLCIFKLMKNVPGIFLHGYEAVYQAEKQKKKEMTPGTLEGLKLVITKPYVLGIFGLVYAYEIISVILDYQMQVLMSIETNNAVSKMSSFMFLYTGAFQALGLIFALFGTSALLKKIGVHLCIMIMPLATILLMLGLLGYPSLTTIFIIMVLLRALNYGFNAPVREILYIPTTKDIKFKSKAWIESFGRSMSKTSGSVFNLLAQTNNVLALVRIDCVFAIAISGIWGIISFLVGAKYHKTIKNNEVIGNISNEKNI
jgi:ATP:ADP antiporter, AAA family